MRTKNRKFKVGDRVAKRHGSKETGRITAIVYVPEAGEYASEVQFVSGRSQLNLNSDLRRIS